MSLSTDLLIDLVARELEPDPASQNKRGSITNQLRQQTALGSGVTAGAADLAFSDRRLLTPGGSDNLDLAGSLTDSFGNSLTFVKLKLIAVRNRSTVAGDVVHVGPLGIANAFVGFWANASDGNLVHPGIADADVGWLVLYAPTGLTVGAGASDILGIKDVTGVSLTYAYDVLLLGTSS